MPRLQKRILSVCVSTWNYSTRIMMVVPFGIVKQIHSQDTHYYNIMRFASAQ